MTAEEQKCYINYLAERVREADLGLRTRDVVLQDFLDKQKEYDERLSRLDEVLSCVEDLKKELASEVKKCKSAERKVSDFTAKLTFADKNRFGDKRQSARRKRRQKAKNRTAVRTGRILTVQPTRFPTIPYPRIRHLPRKKIFQRKNVTCPTVPRPIGLWVLMDRLKCISLMIRKCLDGSLAGRWSRFSIFVNIFNGCRDSFSLRPDKIGLVTCQ